MLKIEKFLTASPDQWKMVIQGMRNPMNSWDRMDSKIVPFAHNCGAGSFLHMGKNDHDLAMRLASGGPVHGKYLRMLPVWVDILAPLYWWKEFDTYKVGTVVNSCSTMHKIHTKKFTLEDFSTEHLISFYDFPEWRDGVVVKIADDLTSRVTTEGPIIMLGGDHFLSPMGVLNVTIDMLNRCRDLYLQTDDKRYWWQMIQLLPSSYNQKRTVMLNYEVLRNIYISRKDHKLDEWHVFCDWIRELPYSELIVGENS